MDIDMEGINLAEDDDDADDVSDHNPVEVRNENHA